MPQLVHNLETRSIFLRFTCITARCSMSPMRHRSLYECEQQQHREIIQIAKAHISVTTLSTLDNSKVDVVDY